MEMPDQPQVDQLLEAACSGDASAAESLWHLVYTDLRQLAGSRMRALPPGQTIQATALVNEAFLRLVGNGKDEVSWQSREHFFGAAARAMRNILVDEARRRTRLKRGGGKANVTLVDVACEPAMGSVNLVDLDGALGRLEAIAPRACEVTVLRFFGGLSIAECARELDISAATVEREWAYARAWLRRDLDGEADG